MDLKRLIKYSRKYLKLNILGSILCIAAVIAAIYIPVITKELVDRVLIAGEFEIMNKLIITLFGLTVIRIGTEYSRS